MLVRSMSKALKGLTVFPASTRVLSGSSGALQQQADQAGDFAHPTEQPTSQGTSFTNYTQGLQTIDEFDSAQINYVSLVGNVVTQPVLRLDRVGRAYSNLLIAQNRRKKGTNEELPADFYTVGVHGALAQQVLNQVRKGQRVLIEARLTTETLQQRNVPDDLDKPSQRVLKLMARNVSIVARRPRPDQPAGTSAATPAM